MSDNITPHNYIPLDSISVANPCNADWNAMKGDDRSRFCGTCQKNVYNLSDMSRREAEELLRSKGESLCAQFARRADGTVITDNCPVGLRPLRNGAGFVLRAVAMGAATVITLLTGLVSQGIAVSKTKSGHPSTNTQQIVKRCVVVSVGRTVKLKPHQAGAKAKPHKSQPARIGKKAQSGKKPKTAARPPQVLTGFVAPPKLAPAPTPAPPKVIRGGIDAPRQSSRGPKLLIMGEPSFDPAPATRPVTKGDVGKPAPATTPVPVPPPVIRGEIAATPQPAPVPPELVVGQILVIPTHAPVPSVVKMGKIAPPAPTPTPTPEPPVIIMGKPAMKK